MSYQGIVQSIQLKGKHGPYAIATVEGLEGTITFSLSGDVWGERAHPENGVYVILEEICKKRAGWRANKARFLKPEDEKQSENKKGAK